jgi:hypothetical protein
MNDIFGVQIFQSLAQLLNIICSLFFRVMTIGLLLQVFIELTARRILKNKIDLLFIPEESIHSEYILVP